MSLERLIILLCFSFLSLNLSGQSEEIADFDSLLNALSKGEHVRVVLHYGKCNKVYPADSTQKSPDVIAAMDLDIFEYFGPGVLRNPRGFLVFSQAKLIQNPIGKGFVYNYGKVRVNADHSVLVTAKYVKTKNFKVIMEQQYQCRMDAGENSGARFFKQ